MRFLVAAGLFASAETALAHTPDTSFLGDFGHQMTSLHHSPAAMLLGVVALVLVLVAARKLTTR
jgi:hypothetical protein